MESTDQSVDHTGGNNPSHPDHPGLNLQDHPGLNLQDHPGLSLHGLQAQINNIEDRLQQVIALLQHQASQAPQVSQARQAPPAPPVPTPVPEPSPAPEPPRHSVADICALSPKEIAKQSLNFTEKQRLSGPENYQQWHQAIAIQFRAFQIPGFLENPDSINTLLTDAQRAALSLPSGIH